MTLGEKIKTHRKLKGLTQKQLGQMTGIHEVAIRKYELDKVKPRPEQLEKIAMVLGVPINVFLDISIATDRDVMPLLFDIDEEFPIRIVEIDGVPSLQFEEEGFNTFLRNWATMKEMVAAGAQSEENYEFWKTMMPTVTRRMPD